MRWGIRGRSGRDNRLSSGPEGSPTESAVQHLRARPRRFVTRPGPAPLRQVPPEASEEAQEEPGLLPPGAEPAGLPETVLDRRSARRNGRDVASLACLADHGAYVVRCEIYPAYGTRSGPILRGPHRFATLSEANAFLDEAGRALECLGCHVS